jgi:ribosomal protein L37AE/L43A
LPTGADWLILFRMTRTQPAPPPPAAASEETSPSCPRCGGRDTRKHGRHLGRQRHYCKACGLAFTGGIYHYRPEQEVRALHKEIQRLGRLVEAARRLRAALAEYENSGGGRALRKLKAKEERFDRLLAAARNPEQPSRKAAAPAAQPGLFE